MNTKSFDDFLGEELSQEALDGDQRIDLAALKELSTLLKIFDSVVREQTVVQSEGGGNSSENLSLIYMPQIRLHFLSTYPLFFALYGIVLFGAVFLNVGMLYYLISRRFLRDPLFIYITNLAVSDLLLVVFGIPYKLSVTIFQSFILGKFLCITGSMLQQVPSLVGILTYVVLAADRYRRIYYPLRQPLPPRICLVVVWILAVCIPLPSSFFHGYVDMSRLWNHFKSQHPHLALPQDFLQHHRVCYLFIQSPVLIYARVIFTLFYVLPLAVIALLYVRCSLELSSRANQVIHNEHVHLSPLVENSASGGRLAHQVTGNNNLCLSEKGSGVGAGGSASGEMVSMETAQEVKEAGQYFGSVDQDSVNSVVFVNRFLALMTTIYAVAWMPMRVLNLSHPLFFDISERRGEKYLDICYLTFALFSFGVTWVNPLIVTRWKILPMKISQDNGSNPRASGNHRFNKLPTGRESRRETPRSSYNSTEF